MMRRILCLAGVVVGLAAGPALADSIPDVEHGRAQARAGRDVSEQEADLLDRWGDDSGSWLYEDEVDDSDEDDYDEDDPLNYAEPYPPRRRGHYRAY